MTLSSSSCCSIPIVSSAFLRASARASSSRGGAARPSAMASCSSRARVASRSARTDLTEAMRADLAVTRSWKPAVVSV